MESENSNLIQKNIDINDVNISAAAAAAAARGKYKRLILVFKFFFVVVTLIIGALIIYLLRDVASDSQSDRSIHINYLSDQSFDYPIVNAESQIFDTQFLEIAAEELSLILLKFSPSDADATTRFALKACRRSLLDGSGQIRRAMEVDRVMAMNQIRHAEDGVKACVDDLEKVESTAVIEARAKVLRAQVYLRDWGYFLVTNGESFWQRKLSSVVAANWALILENVYLVCVGGLQFSFIIYLVWALFKFR